VPNWAKHQFLLHYYGPYKRSDGNFTFQTVSASRLAFASAPEGDADPQLVAQNKISASIFKDKIVLVGVSAQATYDDKSTPIAEHVPGVYVHATAIENLLNGQYVHPIEPRPAFWISLTACLLASIGIILPRMVMWKIMSAVATVIVLLAAAIAWFVGSTIYWLPMASPLLALVIAIIGAFARSYFLEDRQRRLLLKALAQYISPAVAAQIQRNPNIKLGGERRDMTVMFSDIQGFTDLSETMDSQKLSELLNFYLGEMAALVLSNNGTLDKYIGDAIMSFWNAPLLQPEHAELACRAALAMRDREAQIQDKLAERGAAGMLTRIGINTGPMVFGNMGSRQKFNYSVLGDSVNLGSRLEGANKFYGSRILIADTTARLVIGKFVLRQLDLLKVKGREKPVGVYELMAEGESNADMREKIERYGEAFAAYQAQRWDQADAILEQLHARFPNDLPTAALRKRIEKLRHDPPPKDWDGVYTAKDK
jgi:adenylate cyclase